MRILIVSSYPPTRCGIGTYAANWARRLRDEGHAVEVMSLDGLGDVDYLVDWTDRRARRAALARFREFDRVLLNYSTGLLPADPEDRDVFHADLGATMRSRHGRHVEVIVHEVDYLAASRAWRRLHRFWRSAPTILFHTAPERDRFLSSYPRVRRDRIQLIAHERSVYRWYAGTRAEARRDLGLPADQVVFLSAGFIQDTKGVDRAVAIFANGGGFHPRTHYYVVGSARVPEHAEYCAELARAAAAAAALVTMREEFVEDETFDRWLAASDYVVLPYRRIWSSGVFARARAYGTPVIATDVGGLRDQAGADDIIVADDDELREALVAASWRAGGAES